MPQEAMATEGMEGLGLGVVKINMAKDEAQRKSVSMFL